MLKKGTALFFICLFLCASLVWTILAAEVPGSMPLPDPDINGSVITEPVIGVIICGTGFLVLIAVVSFVVVRIRKKNVKNADKTKRKAAV